MKSNRSFRLVSSMSVAVAALLMVSAGPAAAQSHHPQHGSMSHAAAKARSGDDRGCVGGGTWQDRKTCLKEAAAAKQAAQRHRLGTGDDENFMKNRLLRCQSLPAADREACKARMSHPTEVTGSVTGGGMLYEYSETVPLGPTSDNDGAATQRPPSQRMQPRQMQQRRSMPPRPMPEQPRMN